MNPLNQMENLVLAQKADGNFVMAESLAEVEKLATSNPGMFGEEIKVQTARVVKDEKGVPYGDFEGFRFYFGEPCPGD